MNEIEFVCKFLGWTCMLYCLHYTLFCIDVISSSIGLWLQKMLCCRWNTDMTEKLTDVKGTSALKGQWKICSIIFYIYHSICTRNYSCDWTYFLRSALRKIMERDDTSSKRLVLCVSSVQRGESTNPATPSSKQTVLDPEVCLITVLIISKS